MFKLGKLTILRKLLAHFEFSGSNMSQKISALVCKHLESEEMQYVV